jgi:uncharacterized membrane protein
MFNFLFLASAFIFLLMDYIYLTIIKDFFSKQIQKVQGAKLEVNFLGVAFCYIFLIFGINYFIIKPHKSVSDAFLLGLIIYGVYETTNYALLKNWSILTVIVDTLWGGILFATTTYLINMLRKI